MRPLRIRGMYVIGGGMTVAVCCLTAFAAPIGAQWYVAGFPEPARVIAAYGGPDSLDRMARQVAALSVVGQVLKELSLDRYLGTMTVGHIADAAESTPGEARLETTYDSAQQWAHKPEFDRATAQQDGDASIARWFAVVFKYERDTLFKADVLHRFFAPEWITGYSEAQRRSEARKARSVGAAKKRPTAADRLGARAAAAPSRGVPIPDAQRRFAVAVYGLAVDPWCHAEPAAQDNPIAADIVKRKFFTRLDDIIRGVGPVSEWSGTLQELYMETPVFGPADAILSVSIDTASSYRAPLGDNVVGAALAKVRVGPKSPIYEAASKLRVGQPVSISGRVMTPGSFNVQSDQETGARRCQYAIIDMELTAIRPAP